MYVLFNIEIAVTDIR